VKASKASEAGEMPDERTLTEMGSYNERAGQGRHHAGRRGAAPGAIINHEVR
jgi:hypothetical protein